MSTRVRTKDLMQALGVGNNTRTFVLRDEFGIRYEGSSVQLALAALSRTDRTPSLPAHVHRVAYAIYKSMATGRMAPTVVMRIQSYKISKLCGLVAQVHEECYDKTIGEIADDWLIQHADEL